MENSSLTNNTLRVKESNSNLILDTLKEFRVATRTELARETGLSIATCGNILKELVGSGEIIEGDLENLSGGRPARQYIYNENFSLVIAMTLHADSDVKTLRYAVTNLYGEIIEEQVQAYEHIHFDTIDRLVGNLMKTHENIKAIGIGIPGFIENDGTIGINDIEELNGVKLAELLERNHDINVAIDRSPAISAYGYYKTHPECQGNTLATIVAPLDHPVGAGFIINGRIYKGHFNNEGEIHYIYNNFLHTDIAKNENADIVNETVFSVAAIISTINPASIVFMGESFTRDVYDEIRADCRKIFPESFIPDFIFQKNYSEDYLNGTIQMAIDCLRPKVKLISN